MAKRDPNKTARNRLIQAMKIKLRDLLPEVLRDSGINGEASLNAKLGSRNDDFFNLKDDVINSGDQFSSQWLHGLKISALDDGVASDLWLWNKLKAHKSLQDYTILFLKRSFLIHFDELSRNRPPVESAEIWIGQKNANYGLLVTPRFRNGKWENDKSEIRSFSSPYWTIGHVMETGLVLPNKNTIFPFSNIEQYLVFFQDVIVRNSGSVYEYEIAGHYCDYVRKSEHPELIPLLIPEFRYAGLDVKHIFRLDFLIINPYTLDKVGFELSPWSSHGYLAKLGGLTGVAINKMAADNFEKEMRKHRAYFKEHQVICMIITDALLQNTKKLFDEDILPYLQPEKPQVQLKFEIMDEFSD